MTQTAFMAKWRANARNERAAAQEHFLDLCALLDEPTPNSDPTGAAYAFEKDATKASVGEGWADVWRRGRFTWEYKGVAAAYNWPVNLSKDVLARLLALNRSRMTGSALKWER